MSTTIPPEFEDFVTHELAAGNYQTPEEVVSEGLRLLRERKLYELRKDIGAAMEQLERGEGIDLEDEESLDGFFEDIKRRGRLRLQEKR